MATKVVYTSLDDIPQVRLSRLAPTCIKTCPRFMPTCARASEPGNSSPSKRARYKSSNSPISSKTTMTASNRHLRKTSVVHLSRSPCAFLVCYSPIPLPDTPFLDRHSLEFDSTISDCKIAYDRVDKWARAEKPPFSVNWAAFRPVIRKEAKGVILSISPFNYPVWLSLGPMVRPFFLPFLFVGL